MATYSFELGGSDGNAATTANTGASAVVPGTGNTITLDHDKGVIDGNLALQFHVGATTNSCWAEFAALSGSPATMNFVLFPTFDATGFATSSGFVHIFAADNATTVLRLSLSNAGALQISDQGGAHTSTIIADISSSFNAICAVRVTLDQASGAVKARFYSSTNPLAAVGSYTGTEFSATGWSLGTGGFGKQRVGINTAQAAQPQDLWVDYYRVESGWNTWTAGPAATTAPTVDAGVDVFGVSGTAISLTAIGTIGTGGGSISGYSWSCTARPAGAPVPSILTPTAATTSVTGLVDGEYTFSVTATQTGGGLTSAADTTKAWMSPPSGQPVKPKVTTRDPAITREGSVTDDATALLDASHLTGFLWPDNPNGEAFWITWNPAGPNDIVFDLGAELASDSSSGTVHCAVTHYWEDGTTILWGPTTTDITTSDDTPVISGLDSTAMAALGTDLNVRKALKTKVTMSV